MLFFIKSIRTQFVLRSRTFGERFIAYLTGKYSYYDEKGEYHEYTDANLLDLEKNNTNDKNIQKLIDGKNKDRIGIVANQSKTLENMMDYRQPQGGYLHNRNKP